MKENFRPGVYMFRSSMYDGTFRNIVNRELPVLSLLGKGFIVDASPASEYTTVDFYLSHQYLEEILRNALQQFSYNEFR